jgi:aspartate kinase
METTSQLPQINKPILVMKFGGNTLSNKEKILQATALIQKRLREGYAPVVVASANGNLTDLLLDMAYELAEAPDPRELDMLLSTGERTSMSLLSIALRAAGVPAVSLTGSQIGLLTTPKHRAAEILELKNARLRQELEAGNVPVIAGFQGIGTHYEITTLKRGGSDVSAVFLAAELGAERCEMVKDVDAVYSEDPFENSAAEKFSKLDYDQMLRLATMGKHAVLHPDCVRLARERHVKVAVVHYLSGETGTTIG